MDKQKTYPGLYVTEDADTRTLLPVLCGGGYYVILLRNRDPENETFFGRRSCDYSDGMLTCCVPGPPLPAIYSQNSFICRWLLAFRPELSEETPSDKDLSDYTFFYYRPAEALHLSAEETRILNACLHDISTELRHPADRYTGPILSRHIGRILDYTVRFYERQFITRDLVVGKILADYDKMLGHYLETGCICTHGLPSATHCAQRLHLSEACFLDLLRFSTGCTHNCYVEAKRIEIAKRKLTSTALPLRQIVADLGFPSVQYFTSLFKKLTGCNPNYYRFLN